MQDSKLSDVRPSEDSHYIFGYGSLVWKPDIPVIKNFDGYINGFVRRFYQGSPDHRGTVEKPGRVVTLLLESEEKTQLAAYNEKRLARGKAPLVVDMHDCKVYGKLYQISTHEYEEIMEKLNHREKAGYETLYVEVTCFDDENEPFQVKNALVFRATTTNEHFLGIPEDGYYGIAKHIQSSVGPSGLNIEYLLNLIEALKAMETRLEHEHVVDHHLKLLHSELEEIQHP